MSPGFEAVHLREVRTGDLAVFYTHQQDPEACAMAAFPSRGRHDFAAHWARVLADPSALNRTIVADGEVAGYIACFGPSIERSLGYWLGREFWGRGIGTAAVAHLLSEVPERPLFAHVAEHNVGSLRVLEKCGFTHDGVDDGITEIQLKLAGGR